MLYFQNLCLCLWLRSFNFLNKQSSDVSHVFYDNEDGAQFNIKYLMVPLGLDAV